MGSSSPKSYFIDMDGVLMRGAAPIPGAPEFISRLAERGAKFLLLTNNSMYTPRDLRLRLERSGLHAPAASISTSALAPARGRGPRAQFPLAHQQLNVPPTRPAAPTRAQRAARTGRVDLHLGDGNRA